MITNLAPDASFSLHIKANVPHYLFLSHKCPMRRLLASPLRLTDCPNSPHFPPILGIRASCHESSPGLLLKGRTWFLHEPKMWSNACWRLSHPRMLTPLLTQWQKLPGWGDSGGRRYSDGCLDLLEVGTQLMAPNVGIKILTLQVQPDPVQEGSLGRDRRSQTCGVWGEGA